MLIWINIFFTRRGMKRITILITKFCLLLVFASGCSINKITAIANTPTSTETISQTASFTPTNTLTKNPTITLTFTKKPSTRFEVCYKGNKSFLDPNCDNYDDVVVAHISPNTKVEYVYESSVDLEPGMIFGVFNLAAKDAAVIYIELILLQGNTEKVIAMSEEYVWGPAGNYNLTGNIVTAIHGDKLLIRISNKPKNNENGICIFRSGTGSYSTGWVSVILK
jgi:hypothetical protein